MDRSEDSRPSDGDMTVGGVANSPAVAVAVRARRARLDRARQGLGLGQTPATTVAAAPTTMTPAVGTADALDGAVEFSTGVGDPGELQGTGVVREAIQALSRAGAAVDTPTSQVTGTAVGIKTPARHASAKRLNCRC